METRTVTTPSGKTVVLRAAVTGRMKQQIEAVFLDAGKLDGGTVTFTGEASAAATNKAFELLVLSVDDRIEGLVDYILDELPGEDFDFIRAEVNKITTPLASTN